MFNHQSIQKEVEDAFNHVSEVLEIVTEDYTQFLAMQSLVMQKLDDHPQNGPDGYRVLVIQTDLNSSTM